MSKYTVKCFSKDGEEMALQEMDREICDLWNVPVHEENRATPPKFNYGRNWHDFLLPLIYFSMPESGIATMDHLLEFYLKNNYQLDSDFMDHIKRDLYNISLLLYLKNRGVYFTIQYEL